MTITITDDQVDQAKRDIQGLFPGSHNKELRAVLRRQLTEQVNEVHGQTDDPLFPVRVKLGYGILFLQGSGDAYTQNFNVEINKSLGLL